MTIRRAPRIRSLLALRALATAVTVLSFGGMTAFAAAHPKPASAALTPTVVAVAAPTAVPTPVATGRLRLAPQVPTTTRTPVTATHHS